MHKHCMPSQSTASVQENGVYVMASVFMSRECRCRSLANTELPSQFPKLQCFDGNVDLVWRSIRCLGSTGGSYEGCISRPLQNRT